MIRKYYILIGFALSIALTLPARCPDRNLLWKRLLFFRDSAELSPTPSKQLEELLKYEDAIANCVYQYDSTHALLLQRIGVLYFGQGEYTEALQYTLAIDYYQYYKTAGKASAGPKQIIRSYFNLSRIYGILNRVSEKMAAMDSCVAIAVRTGSVEAYSLQALKQRVGYLFDIGDYQRGFVSANMGESIIKRYSMALIALSIDQFSYVESKRTS